MTINFNDIINTHKPKYNNSGELGKKIQSFDFEKILREEHCNNILSESQNTIKLKKCPICGHNDCFVYYKNTKSFYCFGKNGSQGGSIIDYLMLTKNLDKKQAINYFLYELCNLSRIDKFISYEQVFDVISANDLINANIPDPYCCIENLIYQGITILAAPPKYGKSWMSMDMCISVAKGTDFLGFKTHQSGTLYLALEDSKSRVQKRLKKLICGSEVPKDFYVTTDTITIDTGLINKLEDCLQKNPNIKLIVVDTLQKIRGITIKCQNIYAKDYYDIGLLKNFADQHSLCIVVVHHLRKALKRDDDVFNQISGTNAILGAADTALVLKKIKRDNNDGILNICGRDVENEELNVVFDNRTCKWISLGNAEIQESKRQLKEYNDNETIMIIRRMLNYESHWEGTIKELKEFLEQKYACTLKESEAIIAKTLKKYKDVMLKEDKIDYTPAPPNGSNGKRIHRFQTEYYSYMDSDDDIDALFT